MKKSDKLMLKSFYYADIPNDFYNNTQQIMFIDSLLGYVNSLLHKKVLFRDDVERLLLTNEDEKKCVKDIVSKSQDNLQFYYMMKLVIVILLKYSVS